MNAAIASTSLTQPIWKITAAICLMLFAAACDNKAKPETPSFTPPPLAKPEPPKKPEAPSQEELQLARAERNRQVNDAASEARPSKISLARSAYYARVEADLLSAKMLRRDRTPLDAPIDAERLARDFLEIALQDEYNSADQSRADEGLSAPLRRWEQPVKVSLVFGPSADTASRQDFRSDASAFSSRLQKATGGHPVSMAGNDGNFSIVVLSDDERAEIDRYLTGQAASIPTGDIEALRSLSPEIYCTVFAYSRGAAPTYSYAIALIRAELPSLLRQSCIHEELAQGMGLANDSPEARPSIFNDDEEFALLTLHDELLLKILYDPRLRPGMTHEEAAPIVRTIARELLPSET